MNGLNFSTMNPSTPTQDTPAEQLVMRRCMPLFYALGDPYRQDIIVWLAEEGRLNVRQLAERSPLSRPAISHHLKVLRNAHLVTVEREGTENFYALSTDAALADLKAFIACVEAVSAACRAR